MRCYAAASRAVARARAGGGPAFLLCNTYRYHGHHVGDVDRAYYRPKDEEQLWRERARPARSARARWLEARGADRGRSRRIEDEVRPRSSAAVAFALEAPFPDPSEVTDDVYA